VNKRRKEKEVGRNDGAILQAKKSELRGSWKQRDKNEI
jgi:hypothetical protein